MEEFKDATIRDILMEISKNELEKCKQEKKVPSKEVLDTINTLSYFYEVFFKV